MLILFLCFIFFYFTIIGYLIIFERKVLAFFQIRKGVGRIGSFNFYHFYLDFLKLLIKGISKVFFKYLLLLISILFVIIVSFLLLPFNCFGLLGNYGVLFYLMFDSGLVFLKIVTLTFLGNKVMLLFCERLKYLLICIEGLYVSFFLFFIFFITGITNNCSWYSFFFLFNEYNFFSKGIVSLFFILFFFISLFKLFRTPFDYFEIESEFSGGGVLEFYGLSFATWSLIEYSLILNNVLFLYSIFSSIFWFSILLFNFLTFTTLSSRGVLIRIRFFSIFTFFIKSYLILLTLIVLIFGFYYFFL